MLLLNSFLSHHNRRLCWSCWTVERDRYKTLRSVQTQAHAIIGHAGYAEPPTYLRYWVYVYFYNQCLISNKIFLCTWLRMYELCTIRGDGLTVLEKCPRWSKTVLHSNTIVPMTVVEARLRFETFIPSCILWFHWRFPHFETVLYKVMSTVKGKKESIMMHSRNSSRTVV